MIFHSEHPLAWAPLISPTTAPGYPRFMSPVVQYRYSLLPWFHIVQATVTHSNLFDKTQAQSRQKSIQTVTSTANREISPGPNALSWALSRFISGLHPHMPPVPYLDDSSLLLFPGEALIGFSSWVVFRVFGGDPMLIILPMEVTYTCSQRMGI